MWLSRSFLKEKKDRYASVGVVGGSEDVRVSAASESGTEHCAMVVPAGMISVPSKEDEAVIIETKDCPVCVGVKRGYYGNNYSPGEVILFSDGGSRILLDNQGDIYITAGHLYLNGEEIGNA